MEPGGNLLPLGKVPWQNVEDGEDVYPPSPHGTTLRKVLHDGLD